MTHVLAGARAGMAARVWTFVCSLLLLALVCLMPVASAFAAEPAPGQAAPGRGAEQRGEGPRNPYDMKALRQFDAGSHRAEEPPAEQRQPPKTQGS